MHPCEHLTSSATICRLGFTLTVAACHRESALWAGTACLVAEAPTSRRQQQVARQLGSVCALRVAFDLHIAVKDPPPAARCHDAPAPAGASAARSQPWCRQADRPPGALVQLLSPGVRVIQRQACVQVVRLVLPAQHKGAHDGCRGRAGLHWQL